MKPFVMVLLSSAASLSSAQGTTSQSSAPDSGGTSALTAIGPFVHLQSTSPGVAQSGNSNITGTALANQFVGTTTFGSGVVGSSMDSFNSAVYGENYPGYGVVGRSFNTGVWGDNVGTGAFPVGVFGSSIFSSTGVGLWGRGPYGVICEGTAHVSGDLVVTGSKTGYVVDLIKNGDSVPLAPGELVEIMGSEPAVLGDIPVAIVRRASAANARAVLGPISNALAIGPELATPPQHVALVEGESLRLSAAQPASAPLVLRVEGAILPGGYGNVVTLGAFRAIKVDARFGAVHAGDLLVASPELGFAMSASDPRTGTVIGKALAPWSVGQGEIPVMVGMR